MNLEQTRVRDELAQRLFDAPYEDWDAATEAGKQYYRALADRALKATREILGESPDDRPPVYWAGMRLADYLMGGESVPRAESA